MKTTTVLAGGEAGAGEGLRHRGFLNVLEPYYRGGEYDYLLNSDKQLDLLQKRFIVFEIDAIKDHPISFPVTTIIIMELFINKMRRLKGIRKMILIEEAWKARSRRTWPLHQVSLQDRPQVLRRGRRGDAGGGRHHLLAVVKESIINNSDCKILLDQRKYMNKFDQIQALLGLTEKEKAQILSINMANTRRGSTRRCG